MTTDTKTDTLARLRELAMKAMPGPWHHHPTFAKACDPQTILRLLDVIAAADRMHTTREYDAARAALDKP